MFKTILSKLKPAQTNLSRAEEAMLTTLANPEKTAALVSRFEAALTAAPDYSAVRRFEESRLVQARLAMKRHVIDSERQRVAAVMQADQAICDQDLQTANENHATALRALGLCDSRREAVLKRLEPLEAEQTALGQAALQRAAAAQIEFDEAITTAAPEGEAIAATKLFQAQKDCEGGSVLNGPLGLRIVALQREIQAVSDAMDLQQSAVDQAAQARLDAQAALASLEYDRQAQALLEAYLAQRIAISAAQALQKPGAPTKVFWNQKIDKFESQISSTQRIIFGGDIDPRTRHLSNYAIDDLCRALEFKPNLSLLVSEFEAAQPESIEPEDTL
ncbi:hypothetical protein [Rhodoferax antarcticus]|uniref:Uncharacterized protein n=1 Tax=Rhodoferax antarcticus ANT.BR TaxID=1111071 RepID=A0A1Q8YAW2_9BURK|nr:hypothetical protein [Rhodoferax antarcticus]OLP05155.1 hypothetical protein BLL52_3976 [Rhodoferax antarcticus ANT.BR]